MHRYARCLSYPEWGVGSVNGIYFTGGGDDIQQWARVSFQPGIRTVPAGSLQFVDFSKPDPGAERVERFMTAAKHALAEGDFKLAARRLVYARDAEPDNTQVLRLMTLAFWQAGDYSAAARAVRDWIRVERERPAPYRYAARIYEDMGALSQAVDAAEREVAARAQRRVRVGAPRPPAAAQLRPRAARARRSSARASSEPSEQGLLDLALVANLMGDVGAEVSACEQATQLAPGVAGRVVALRARARPHRPGDRLPRGLRARARARATIPRCATCATRSRAWSRASSEPPDGLEHGAVDDAGRARDLLAAAQQDALEREDAAVAGVDPGAELDVADARGEQHPVAGALQDPQAGRGGELADGVGAHAPGRGGLEHVVEDAVGRVGAQLGGVEARALGDHRLGLAVDQRATSTLPASSLLSLPDSTTRPCSRRTNAAGAVGAQPALLDAGADPALIAEPDVELLAGPQRRLALGGGRGGAQQRGGGGGRRGPLGRERRAAARSPRRRRGQGEQRPAPAAPAASAPATRAGAARRRLGDARPRDPAGAARSSPRRRVGASVAACSRSATTSWSSKVFTMRASSAS